MAVADELPADSYGATDTTDSAGPASVGGGGELTHHGADARPVPPARRLAQHRHPRRPCCCGLSRNLLSVMVFSALMSYASTGTNAILYEYFHHILGVNGGNSTFGVSAFICLYNTFAVLGAVAADLRVGKYRMQVVTSVLWIAGSVAILVCTLLAREGAGMGVKLLLTFAGIGVTAVGYGAQQPSQAAFVGDQASTLEDVSTFFAVYYTVLNVGSLFGESLCPILRQHVGVDVTFMTVVGAQLVAFVALMAGRGSYVQRNPKRSVAITGCADLVGRYNDDDWRDLRNVLKVFSALPIFWALFFQQNSTWVTQTSKMDMRLIYGTPDALASINDVMVCCMVPAFDRWVYPAFRRCYTMLPLRKISIGVLNCALAFVCAGYVEHLINVNTGPKLSVLWQLPQYVFISIAETMVAVTGLEFAYSQCGPNTRSLVQALWALMQLGQILTGLIAKFHVGSLEQDFYFYAALMVVFLLLFVAIASRYEYKPGTATDDVKDDYDEYGSDEGEEEGGGGGGGDVVPRKAGSHGGNAGGDDRVAAAERRPLLAEP